MAVHKASYLVLSVLFLFVLYCDAGFPEFIDANGFNFTGANVCRYPASKTKNVTTMISYVAIKKYTTTCRYQTMLIPLVWASPYWPCSKIKKYNVTKNETITKNLHGYSLKCCLHWKRNSENDTECKKPICPNGCVHGTCIAGDTCRCDKGWQGYTCNQDINECYENNGACEHECYNQLGSYKCVCRRGFRVDPKDPLKCIDVNECNSTRTRCVCDVYDPTCQPKCTNRIGSYRCQCPNGYRLFGQSTCTDVNECLSRNDCTNKCVNTVGGYRCECFKGMALKKGTNKCHDINECKTNNGGCEQTCLNTFGSFYCRCKLGYRKRHKKCIKIIIPDFD